MILDRMEHAKQYAGLLPGVDRALSAMTAYNASNYPGGRVEVDGDRIFLLLNQYETMPPEKASFETHRRYLDVMYMVEGEETVYVKPAEKLNRIIREYDAESDALLAEMDPDASAVRLTAGQFLVLFPQDAHAPACYADGASDVKKIIGKVRLNQEQRKD